MTSEYMTDQLFDVSGQTVVITGAAGLIGSELVRAFRARGANVAAVDVAFPEGWDCGGDLAGAIEPFPCDVSKSENVRQLVGAVEKRFGVADVLINSHHYKPTGFLSAQAETFPDELWDSIINVNLRATFITCREFGSRMLQQGRGSIINFASTYGLVSSNPDLYEDNSLGNPVAYTASKGGVIMLTKYLGAYWAARGVRVNCVTPHGVARNQEEGFLKRFNAKSPMKRIMTADEITGAVIFLASRAGSYAVASNVVIDGGWTAW